MSNSLPAPAPRQTNRGRRSLLPQGALGGHASVLTLTELRMHETLFRPLVDGVCHSRKRAQQASSTDDRNAIIPSDYSSRIANGSQPALAGSRQPKAYCTGVCPNFCAWSPAVCVGSLA
jgi:hypothetical protein